MRESSEKLNNQAIRFAQRGEYFDAIACLKRAITVENSNFLLWFNLGITYRDAGDFKNAKEGDVPVDEEKKQNVYETSVINKFKDVRILLVEDNELNRDIARELLQTVGFILDEAENGEQAIQMVSDAPSGHYKVILMDVMMPLMNGYDATTQIRALEDRQKSGIPIIAMTANAFEEDKNQAMECGMDGFISKPFDINDLLSKLSDMIDMKEHKKPSDSE